MISLPLSEIAKHTEKLFAAFFALSLLAAAATPNPLLQVASYPSAHRVFPTRVTDRPNSGFELPSRGRGARIELTAEFGCLQVRRPNGVTTGKLCNRHLHCGQANAPPPLWRGFEVYRTRRVDIYYVETGSACYSFCCDSRGMMVSADGRRLDDNVVDRIALRLGAVGTGSACLGILCLLLHFRRRNVPALGIGVAVSFGIASGLLWWNH